MVVAAAALAVGLTLSAGFASMWYVSVRRGQQQTFHQVTNRATDDIASSITDVGIMQRGLQGLYAGSGEVTQDEFRTYLRSLSDDLPLANRFPGLLGALVVAEEPDGARVELAEPPGAQAGLIGRHIPAGSPLAVALVLAADLDLPLLVPAGDLGDADSAIVAPLEGGTAGGWSCWWTAARW